jgi:hypothetical protein
MIPSKRKVKKHRARIPAGNKTEDATTLTLLATMTVHFSAVFALMVAAAVIVVDAQQQQQETSFLSILRNIDANFDSGADGDTAEGGAGGAKLVVVTEEGAVMGRREDSKDVRNPILAFRGVPYAEPPLGDLRFQASVYYEPSASKPGLLCTPRNFAQSSKFLGKQIFVRTVLRLPQRHF